METQLAEEVKSETLVSEETKPEVPVGFLKKNFAQIIIAGLGILLTLLKEVPEIVHHKDPLTETLGYTSLYFLQPVVWFLCSIFFRNLFSQLIVWFIFECIWGIFLGSMIGDGFFVILGTVMYSAFYFGVGLSFFALIAVLNNYRESLKEQKAPPEAHFKFLLLLILYIIIVAGLFWIFLH